MSSRVVFAYRPFQVFFSLSYENTFIQFLDVNATHYYDIKNVFIKNKLPLMVEEALRQQGNCRLGISCAPLTRSDVMQESMTD